MKEVAKELRDKNAEPRADTAADRHSQDNDCNNKLDVMANNRAIGIAESLQETDLLSLKRYQPSKRQIDKERRYQKEDRCQRSAHVTEHVEFVIDPGVRSLILPSVRGTASVLVEQSIQTSDDFALGRV